MLPHHTVLTLKRSAGVTVLAFAIALVAYCWSAAGISAAHKAKVLCSAVFVSKQPIGAVETTDLAELSFVSASVDEDRHTVTTAAFGLVGRQAVYRDGFGCTLEPAAPVSVPAPPLSRTADLPWPRGDAVAPDPVPAAARERIEAALDGAFAEPADGTKRATRAVVIVQEGRIVGERYAPGFGAASALPGWSMTKSVMNALVGIRLAELGLSLDQAPPVPEWSAPGDPRGDITFRHLLQMQSGLAFDEEYTGAHDDTVAMLLGADDAAAFAARRELEYAPGTHWSYASGSTNILSRWLRATFRGDDAAYWSLPRRALFDRLGMASAVIEPDPSGTFVGSSFMFATARDWARFGLLYLDDGLWNSERILPAGWVEFTRTPASNAPQGEYGAQWWTNGGAGSVAERRPMPTVPGDAFQALGYQGQSLTVVPSRAAVIVRLGMTKDAAAWDREAFIARVLDALPAQGHQMLK